MLIALALSLLLAGDPWTDPGLVEAPRTACVNACPVVACPRTCPEEGERWEIRVTYKGGPTVGPPTVGGCFGAQSQTFCYQQTHVAQKGVPEVLPPSDPRCAPGLAECVRNIHPSEILETIAVRIR